MGQADGEHFELRSYLLTLRRRKRLIALVAAGIVACALVASLVQTATYRASAEVVLQPRSTESVFNPSSSSASAATPTVETEIRVIRSDSVRNAVRGMIGSAPRVSVTRVGETEVMKISATSTSAERAARVANAYAKAYVDFRKSQAVGDLKAASEQIKAKIDSLQVEIDDLVAQLALGGPDASGLGPRYNTLLTQQGLLAQKYDSLQVDATLKSGGAQLITEATVSSSPHSPKPLRNGLLALVVGLVLGTALAFVREHLDDSVRSKDDLAAALPGIPVLGVVPVIDEWDAHEASTHLQSLQTASTPAAEAYRSLRASIQLLGVERPLRTVQVTSPAAGEGKTTLLANLAVLLAVAGQRVVMVDCDLRRPTLHQLFDVPNETGFTSVFLEDASPLAVVQPVKFASSLYIVPSGPHAANPSELLSSNRAAEFLFELQAEFDIVLVDSAPVLPVADSVSLAAWVEATVLVARSGDTTGRALAEAVERLNQVDARVIGTVLNQAVPEATYGYYGYPYSQAANGKGNGLTRRPRQKQGPDPHP